MRSSHSVWRTGLTTVVLLAALGACGSQYVEVDAREESLVQLEQNVRDTLACAAAMVPGIDPEAGDDVLREELDRCTDTDASVLAGPSVDPDQVQRSRDHVTALGSAVITDGRLEIHLVTEGTGYVQAGITSARVTSATCWQLTADLEADVVAVYSGATCDEAVMAWMDPSEVVAFEALEISDAAP